MKVYTITCHDVYNYGASLQAYALMRYVENLGHNVEIIDYKPDYLSRHYALFGCSNPKYKKNCILRLAYNILKFPKRLFDLRKKNAFDKYQKSHLNVTARRYRSNEELKELPYGDIYICGSDQIWNPLFKNGNDPAFYLDFAPTNKTRISYAASLAVDQIPETSLGFMKCMITGLNAVSVREEKGVQLLSELGIQSIRVVDPVFLHDKEFWVSEIAKTRLDCLNQKYIFVYDFDRNETIRSFAIDYARTNGLEIVTVFTFNVNC